MTDATTSLPCAICGAQFDKCRANQTTCGPVCGRENRRLSNARRSRERNAAARALADGYQTPEGGREWQRKILQAATTNGDLKLVEERAAIIAAVAAFRPSGLSPAASVIAAAHSTGTTVASVVSILRAHTTTTTKENA